MLPSTIPIFPLPNVVLFPNVFLPLHIFEPRYRAMVSEALEGDRIIGMVLLKPGFESNYEGRPPIYQVGCAGVITHSEPLADGRFNIVLRGLEKFRVIGEDRSKSYRMAQVDSIPEDVPESDRRPLRQQRTRLEAVLAAAIERSGAEPRFPPAVADEDLVNALDAGDFDLVAIGRSLLANPDWVKKVQSGQIGQLRSFTKDFLHTLR